MTGNREVLWPNGKRSLVLLILGPRSLSALKRLNISSKYINYISINTLSASFGLLCVLFTQILRKCVYLECCSATDPMHYELWLKIC